MDDKTPMISLILDPDRHSFLKDHALRGRPFLPLACALDLMAQASKRVYPIAFKQVMVKRGLMVPRPTEIVVREHEGLVQLYEVRKTGREVLAFQAEHCLDPPIEPPVMQGTAEVALPELSMADFYASRTFHGPSLQGIRGTPTLRGDLLQGQVSGCSHSEWMPDSTRAAWCIDPLVVDSAFQLAMYWCIEKTGRALLPEFLDEFVLLAPFCEQDIKVVVSLSELDQSGPSGRFQFFSNERLIAWMSGRGKFFDGVLCD